MSAMGIPTDSISEVFGALIDPATPYLAIGEQNEAALEGANDRRLLSIGQRILAISNVLLTERERENDEQLNQGQSEQLVGNLLQQTDSVDLDFLQRNVRSCILPISIELATSQDYRRFHELADQEFPKFSNWNHVRVYQTCTAIGGRPKLRNYSFIQAVVTKFWSPIVEVVWYTYLIKISSRLIRNNQELRDRVREHATRFFNWHLRQWIESRPYAWDSILTETEDG